MWSPSLPHRVVTAVAIVLFALTAFTGPPTAMAAPAARVSANWAWPVPVPHPIVRTFVAPETPYSAGHRGIDIAAPLSTIVRAPTNGTIHFSGFVVNRSLVSIDHGNGILSSFEPVLSSLTEGTFVRRGEPIGVLQSGHCSTPCLHFGVRRNGQYVSPLNYLGGLEHSVLLPTRMIR